MVLRKGLVIQLVVDIRGSVAILYIALFALEEDGPVNLFPNTEKPYTGFESYGIL